MSLTLVTGPASLPLTLDEAKEHLREDSDAQDALIYSLIRAVTDHVDGRDGILGRALLTQTWDLTLNAFPAGAIYIPLAPVQSITSISYTDQDGNPQTFSSASYSLNADTSWRPRIDLGYDDSWPTVRDIPGAVTVRFVAGYGDHNAVPHAIRQALMLWLAHLYEHRESVSSAPMSEIPMGARALLSPYRRLKA